MISDPARIFVLGTVQLGLPYGVSRPGDALPNADAILDTARDLGVGMLDTAAAYGIAEDVIGAWLAKRHDAAPIIVTKLHPQADLSTPESVVAQVAKSGARLGVRPDYVLLHRASLLDAWNGPVGAGLLRARDEGMCRALGVSIYGPDEFERALDHPDMKMIQAPLSVLDRRLVERGLIAAAAERGVEVVLRSVFLQGLLLMAPGDIPAPMAFAIPSIAAFQEICRRHGVAPAHAALAGARDLAPTARQVIGCHSPAHLRDNLRDLGRPIAPECLEDLRRLPQGDDILVNPALWPREQ